ncbi:GcrA family cell cycle regulator [Hansschlegelia quercus]|uniref:GcrA cell cycle regulator n=1 Tax=Hansschlegelia quercus TaxID=2528245 RepID=A0A4Q9GIZ6_9HYPH|nr:GcrA family cell cycle regulator [Hansschlegelia quercus]TBN54028.1 GcrA cell cycle regulator [Hansschlegelia quercus]
MQWTDERVELLKKRWADGLSASQIAAELGGVTRNAVIGKVHRLGLSGRVKAQPSGVARLRVKPAPTTARRGAPSAPREHVYASHGGAALQAVAQPQARVMPQPRVTPIELVETQFACERVTIMELRENMCRWPLGDPSQTDFRFCGGRSSPGDAYCSHHAQIAYQPANDRRRDRRPAIAH